MSLVAKNRKWIFICISALVAITCIVVAVIYTDPESNTASSTAQQEDRNTPEASASTQTDNNHSSLVIMDARQTVSEQNSIETNSAVLPPISVEVANEIRKLSNHTTEGLVEEKHADGSVSMDLQGHFQTVTAAVRGSDGKIIIRHGEDFLPNVQPDNNSRNP